MVLLRRYSSPQFAQRQHGEDRAVIHQHPLSSLSPVGVEPWQIQGREDRNPVLEEEQHEYVSPKRSGPYRGCMVILSCCAQWLCLNVSVNSMGLSDILPPTYSQGESQQTFTVQADFALL
ncbi:Uncharacterized protein DAT39_010888 [Clarias magur]|uniref:Uncharacterized protein n=1 Tax=Clarias magur TaxID=1594786 RepID=A0A8J4U486_CLAMG|nr:Uncharacterized protein DAT39_010888 [Clarias magur]